MRIQEITDKITDFMIFLWGILTCMFLIILIIAIPCGLYIAANPDEKKPDNKCIAYAIELKDSK